ncbi:MAG: hypothetical protein NTZ37_09310 [Methanoregula sp.]|nr:hypothetical protein [Methanoregula sp.]
MRKINGDEFFAQYPKYQNLDKLKQADILIMPLHIRKSFTGDQRAFYSLVSDPDVNCLFYSEEKNKIPFYAEFSTPPPELILYFGTVIITSLAGLIKIYEFLKKEAPRHRFRIKHIIAIKDDYYEMEEFEGSIEDYNKVYQNMKSSFESCRKENENLK